MSRRSQRVRDRRLRLCLWGVVTLILAFAYCCMHPFVIKGTSRHKSGSQITLDTISDFLIVVDYNAFQDAPDSFMDMTFSLAWLNTFQQELGAVALVDTKGFEKADLKAFQTLILTASVGNQDAWVPRIRSFLERGGTVVMEMPTGELRTIASADGKGGVRTPQVITHVQGLSTDDLTALSALHLSSLTTLIGSAGPLEDSKTWMTIDGVPVVYSKNYALGRVITVDFNYGMLLTALQQGRPLDHFEIRNLRGTSQIESFDLAQDLDLTVPYADLLERFLIYGVINDATPTVGLWPYFDGMDGALLVAHQENGQGDAALWMAEYEATFKATSTIFASIPLNFTDSGLDTLDATHAEIGLAITVPGDTQSQAREPLGPFRISPIWQQLNIEDQYARARERLNEQTPLITAQTRHGLWRSEYTSMFEMLTGAGFRIDASYRADPQHPGYAFSTGMPFMPLDRNGLLFNLLEFPVAFTNLTTAQDLSTLEAFLKQSAESHHEVLTVAFDPSEFPQNPVVETFQTWQSTYHLATKYRHWVTSFMNYFRFNRARYTSELRTKTTHMTLANKPSKILRIELLAPEAGMNITVPTTLGDRTFTEARRGVQRVREDAVLSDVVTSKKVSLSGFERILVPVNKGFNALDILYE